MSEEMTGAAPAESKIDAGPPGSRKQGHDARHALRDLGRVHKPASMERLRTTATALDPTELARMGFDGTIRSGGSRFERQIVPDAMKQELEHPIDVTVNDGVENQQIRFLLLNTGELLDPVGNRKPITVFFPGITAEVDSKMGQLAARELAKVIDGPLIIFDIPPFGGSGAFTEKQRAELAEGKGMAEIARAHLRALRLLLKTSNVNNADVEFNITGSSLGGFMAAEVARLAADPEFNIKVRNVVLHEAPGVEQLGRKELFDRLMSLKDMQEFYGSVPYDWETRDALDLANNIVLKTGKQAKWFFKNVYPSLQMTKSLGQKVIPEYVQEILQNQPHVELMDTYGTASNMSSHTGHEEMFAHLQDTLDEPALARAHRDVMEGSVHAVGLNPYDLAQLIAHDLKRLEEARASRGA